MAWLSVICTLLSVIRFELLRCKWEKLHWSLSAASDGLVDELTAAPFEIL